MKHQCSPIVLSESTDYGEFNRSQLVGSHSGEEASKPVSGSLLQAGTHKVHSIKEHTKSSK